MNIQENRFGFDPEITAKIAKMGIRVKEVPISYYPRTNEEGKKDRLEGWYPGNLLHMEISPRLTAERTGDKDRLRKMMPYSDDDGFPAAYRTTAPVLRAISSVRPEKQLTSDNQAGKSHIRPGRPDKCK